MEMQDWNTASKISQEIENSFEKIKSSYHLMQLQTQIKNIILTLCVFLHYLLCGGKLLSTQNTNTNTNTMIDCFNHNIKQKIAQNILNSMAALLTHTIDISVGLPYIIPLLIRIIAIDNV